MTPLARMSLLALAALAAAGITLVLQQRDGPEGDPHGGGREDSPVRLYWFIPDGLRADPDLFRIFQWAREGRLPNIRRMMEGGAYGYSIPVFPGHTPTNFATLLTGSPPRVHGVADGPMRLQKYPLSVVSKSGFSSHAKLVPPIWYTLEQQGYRVALLSVPGSTPPELDRGITIKGRWGGWGIDFAATNFHTADDRALRLRQGLENRLFEQGQTLTHFVSRRVPSGWTALPESFGATWEVALSNWGLTIHALIYDTTDDGVDNPDRIRFSLDKERVLADLAEGEWGEWTPVELVWQTGNDYNLFTPKKADWELELSGIKVDSQLRIKVVRLDQDGLFRIRFRYDDLNRFLTKPPEVADALRRHAGPMVDFADNFPPQLIYYPEDKQTFMEEGLQSLEWHRRGAGFLMEQSNVDVVIHDIYTPNQFLTSRWWMQYLDPDSARYDRIGDGERAALWDETLAIYQGIDGIIGKVLDNLDEDSWLVLSSDHGAVPLNTRVRLNNLFAREGLLSYTADPETGYPKIDWDNTRAIFLKMDNIYINPDGLGGNYARASGDAYLALRQRVVELLGDLRDANGEQPLAKVLTFEESSFLDLPEDRVGDLVIANRPGYGWSEEITADGEVFAESLTSGYKQGVLPDAVKGMWTPFIVYGPGIRNNHELSRPIRHVDQYPTIMRMLGEQAPGFVEGGVVEEIFEQDSRGR